MKKQISITLAAVILALSLTSCSGTGKEGIGWTGVHGSSGRSGGTGSQTSSGSGGKSNDSDPESKFYQGDPEYDFGEVEINYRWNDYTLDTVDVPWGETHDLHMVNGQIQNYFRYTAFDANDNICNKDLDNTATMSRPRVRAFPADKKGYVVYEVTYTQIYPIRSIMYGTPESEMYEFEGVRYIDYYTGTVLPYLNVFERNGSGGLRMQFIYEGKRYNFGHYQFKVQDDGKRVFSKDEDGNTILTETVTVTRTDYLVVPEDYDGLLLYVYVGDWSSRPQVKVPIQSDVTAADTAHFDDEENLDDYVFFGITRSK